MRRITIIGAACALVPLFAGPAFADCVAEIVQVKQMADQASDPAKREMAVQHLGMAQEKIVDVPMRGEAMQGEAMKDEAMSGDQGMAMKDEAMSGDQGMAMKDEAMSGDDTMAMQGQAEDKAMAMKDEAMSGDQGMAMKGDMAMREDECMAEVMKAEQALQ